MWIFVVFHLFVDRLRRRVQGCRRPSLVGRIIGPNK